MPENSCNAKAKFDALSTPDVKNVVEVLRKAENANTPATPGRHDVWLTEFWWEYQPSRQVHLSAGCGRTTFQTGAFFDNGKKKPAFEAFRNYAK